MESEAIFNNLDYIVVGIVLVSGVLAMMRGFVRELFSLIAWAGAYFIAIYFYEPAIPFAQRYVKNDQVAEWAAMGIVFAVTLIALMIVGHFVCGFVKGKVLTIIDRSLGFLYGLARGALVICLVYLGATMIFWPDIDAPAPAQHDDEDRDAPPEFLMTARTRPIMAFGADALKPLLPDELIDKEAAKEKADERKLELEKTIREETSGYDDGKGPIDIDKLFNGEDQ